MVLSTPGRWREGPPAWSPCPHQAAGPLSCSGRGGKVRPPAGGSDRCPLARGGQVAGPCSRARQEEAGGRGAGRVARGVTPRRLSLCRVGACAGLLGLQCLGAKQKGGERASAQRGLRTGGPRVLTQLLLWSQLASSVGAEGRGQGEGPPHTGARASPPGRQFLPPAMPGPSVRAAPRASPGAVNSPMRCWTWHLG